MNEDKLGTFHSVASTGEVPLQAVDTPEQLTWVEGFPAAGTRFSLVSVKNLWTDKKLDHNQYVSGTFAGRVKGVSTTEDKDGSLLYCFQLEVNDAELL